MLVALAAFAFMASDPTTFEQLEIAKVQALHDLKRFRAEYRIEVNDRVGLNVIKGSDSKDGGPYHFKYGVEGKG